MQIILHILHWLFTVCQQGQRQISFNHMTDRKSETWSPARMSVVRVALVCDGRLFHGRTAAIGNAWLPRVDCGSVWQTDQACMFWSTSRKLGCCYRAGSHCTCCVDVWFLEVTSSSWSAAVGRSTQFTTSAANSQASSCKAELCTISARYLTQNCSVFFKIFFISTRYYCLSLLNQKHPPLKTVMHRH